MPIPVTCTHCGASFGVKEKHAGVKGRCPKCNGTVQVPAAPQTDELDTSWLDDVESEAPPPLQTTKVASSASTPLSSKQPTRTAPLQTSAVNAGARIRFRCGHCASPFEVDSKLAGRAAKCQKCGQTIQVPLASEPTSPEPTATRARPAAHVADPIVTQAKKPVTTAPDDLLSELGEAFGVGAFDETAASPLGPSKPLRHGKSLTRSKGKSSTFELAWPDIAFLCLCLVGLIVGVLSGLWAFVPGVPALFGIWIVIIAGFVHGEIALGLLSFLCGPAAYVIGWLKAREWNLMKVMIGWTVATLIFVPAFLAAPVLTARQMAIENRARAEAQLAPGATLNRPASSATPAVDPMAPVAGPAPKIPPGWQVYESVEAGFRVILPPGQVNRQFMSDPKARGVRLGMVMVESPDKSTAFIIMYSDPPNFVDDAAAQQTLRSARAAVAQQPGTSVTGEQQRTIAGVQAVEVQVNTPQGPMVDCFFFAQGRLFQLMVGRKQGLDPPEYMESFFESFTFLNPIMPTPQALPPGASLTRGGSGGAPGRPGPPPMAEPTAVAEATSAASPAAAQVLSLDEALKSVKSDVPQPGLMALTRLEPNEKRGEVLEAVVPLAESQNHGVRLQVIQVLARWGTDAQLPVLIGLLDDGDTSVRHEAIEAVARFKTAAGAEAIADRLPHDGMQAEEALREMGEIAETAVVRYLKHPEVFTRAKACEILGDIGTPNCAPELFKLERDPSFLVVSAADEALRKIRFRHKIDDAPAAKDGGGRLKKAS